MGAQTDALTAVAAALTTAGVTTVVKSFSTVTPPATEHAVLTVDAGPLERADADVYDGEVVVTVDWFKPGAASDGQTEFLAAIDAFDAIVVAMTAALDRTCRLIDPSGGVERLEESADLAHGYAGTVVCTFRTRYPATT